MTVFIYHHKVNNVCGSRTHSTLKCVLRAWGTLFVTRMRQDDCTLGDVCDFSFAICIYFSLGDLGWVSEKGNGIRFPSLRSIVLEYFYATFVT
jgi:hypothetical protein